jgi:hypothetical protein
MKKSITQDNQNDNQISKSIRRFFIRFHISSALKAANAYKKKGYTVTEIFQYLFMLIFSNRSMYMNLITGRNTPALQPFLQAESSNKPLFLWIPRIVRMLLSLMTPFFLSIAFFFLPKITKTGLMRQMMLIKEPLDITVPGFQWKREHMPCWNC